MKLGRLGLMSFVLFLIAFMPLGVLGQDAEPSPGPLASATLPEGEALGSGWVGSADVSPIAIAGYSFEMSPDVFREGAARVYAGPEGARTIIVSLLLSESRVAIRQSWEAATAFTDEVRYRVSYDYDRREAIQSVDPPIGCVEAKREEGIEEFYLVPMGATMCATDPDGIVIAIVSGSVNGLTGIDASDHVINLILGG